MENNGAGGLIKSNSSIQREYSQIAITKRILESINPFLIPYKKGGTWGFCTKDKKIKIDCVYEMVKPFLEGLAAVKLNDKWGFINKKGNLVIPCIYNNAHSFTEELASVEINNEWGFIDYNGNTIIPFIYESIQPFSEGLAWVTRGGKFWKAVNKNGKTLFPPKSKATVLDYLYCDYPSGFSNNITLITNEQVGKFHEFAGNLVQIGSEINFNYEFWSKEGQLISGSYDEAFSFEQGLACVRHKGKYGYINVNGDIMLQFHYDKAHSFGEGLAPVQKDENWHYINKIGDKIFKIDYDECYTFSSGSARVKKDMKYGYINKESDLVIPCIYDHAENFNGVIAKVKKGNIYFYIDTNGNEYYEK